MRPAAPADTIEAAGVARPSWRVARVAADLDCDPSQVRRLVRAGQLEAHRFGKRGVRVYLDSLRAYKEARRLGRPLAPTSAPAISSPGDREADAYLRRLGIRV